MESLDYWRLCDELSITQAALLLLDIDPSGEGGYVESLEMHERPIGYEAIKTAIITAIQRGTIKGELVQRYKYDEDTNSLIAVDGSVSPGGSLVDVESLRGWLENRGIRTGFFFPAAPGAPDYLDPKNPRYAPKLAAAVRAWQSVTELGGKHPKQALAKWLREHAAEFGMTDDEGRPNETGIEEAAKVANWQPSGGAPKTPGE